MWQLQRRPFFLGLNILSRMQKIKNIHVIGEILPKNKAQQNSNEHRKRQERTLRRRRDSWLSESARFSQQGKATQGSLSTILGFSSIRVRMFECRILQGAVTRHGDVGLLIYYTWGKSIYTSLLDIRRTVPSRPCTHASINFVIRRAPSAHCSH